MASATDESAICPICMTVASQETHNLTSLVSGFLRLRLVSGFLRLRLPGTLADESWRHLSRRLFVCSAVAGTVQRCICTLSALRLPSCNKRNRSARAQRATYRAESRGSVSRVRPRGGPSFPRHLLSTESRACSGSYWVADSLPSFTLVGVRRPEHAWLSLRQVSSV